MREVQWMQWFAEAGPADEAARTGDAAPDAGEQGAEDFETLIRGRYKEAFDARVQRILDGRLRNLRQENMRLRQDAELRQRAAVLQAAVQRQFALTLRLTLWAPTQAVPSVRLQASAVL